MMKYRENGLCKVLSIILAAAMLLTSPMGTMQAYALEDVQPPSEVSAIPAFAEDYPKPDAETRIRTTTAAAISVVSAPGIFEVGTPDELKNALDSLSDGDTIKLTANIDYNDSVTISEAVTFDVGQYILNITATKYDYMTGLEVYGSVEMISTTGELNVTGSRIGVGVRNFIDKNASATVTNATATAAGGIGVHVSSSQPSTVSIVVKGDITADKGKGAFASGSGGNVTVHGNILAKTTGAEAESDARIVVLGSVQAGSCGAKIVTTGSIIIQKGIIATGADGIGAWITNAGSIISHGDITATNYIKFGNTFSGETILNKGEGVADTELTGFTKYSDGSDRVVRVKETKVPAVCKIDSTEFSSLSDAIAAVPAASSDGETTTITLLQSITHTGPVVIDSKIITFALGGFDLTIDTSATSNSIGLRVQGTAKVDCTGSGKLHVIGSDTGVSVSGGSELHISGNVTAKKCGVTTGTANSALRPKLTIDGDVTVTGQGVSEWGEIDGVTANGWSTVTIGGNVTANRTNAMQIVTAVHSNASVLTIGKDVTTQGSGANAQNDGQITIEGVLHYNPTGSGDQAYVKVGYPVADKTAADFEPTSTKPGYKEYRKSIGDWNFVWIKDASAVCTIGAQKFTSLDAAIASVPDGGKATITLLQSITHTEHIRVEKKTINLDLMDYDLLLDTSANTSYSPALMVSDGGKVNLIGSGTGEFNIKSYMTAISAVGINAKATVHNVVAGDSTGVNMVGSGDYLDSNSTVTVLGSITVGNGNGVEVNARGGEVLVGGEIRAGRIGVYVWSNPGTHVTVKGDITVDSFASIAGIRAYGDTNVDVTGNVTVQGNNPESNCVGVHASGSTIKVGGNVASSGMGAQSDTKGKVEITGSLTAGTPFITVGTTEMTADQGIKTEQGSLLYTDGTNTVQIGSAGIPASIYTITVQSDGNGTASANVDSAAQGKEITLTASANGGYQFREWQVISGGVIITGNKFTMPDNNVTVKAIFEETSVQTYTVTVNGSHASATGAGSYTKGATVNIYAGNLSNYTFAGWTSSDVTITGASGKNASFVMPGKAVTVTANWSYNGGGDGGSTPTKLIPTEKQPDMPTVAKPSISGTVKDGILSATITEQKVRDAIKAAQDAAKKSGKELDGIAIDFNVTGSGSYTSLNAAIDAGAIDRLKKSGVKFIKIGSAMLDVTFDAGAIAEIDKQSAGTVTVSAKKIAKLSDAAKKLIGNRPVFDITVSYQKNGKTEYISSFGKGAVTLSIAYKATDKENKGNLFGVYVDKNGKPQMLMNSRYDNGRIIFSRNSLSTYGVGYKDPTPAFTDTTKHWAKENIDFVVSRDLISGTSATTFAPDTAITRADFLMALGKLSGADVSGYKVSSFSDVKSTDTVMPYIEWAVKNNIVSGYGNGKFGPNDSITREQMAVMMVNYAKAIGYKLPVSIAAVTFADNSKISAYAKDAVKAIQQAGIINGKDNNHFDPQGNATRAEAATILRRFVELVIDEGTALGWVQRDAGQ